MGIDGSQGCRRVGPAHAYPGSSIWGLIEDHAATSRRTDNDGRHKPKRTAAHLGEGDRERRANGITNQVVTSLDTSRQENSMRGSPIPNDVVYQQVSHILASRAFRKSIRLRRLLEFI